MLFNSLEFLLYLPIVFSLYWFVFNQIHWQNVLIVIASYIFYGYWDWRFLLLIATTTIFSFTAGVLIERFETRRTLRKVISGLNIIINLLILCIFKYYDFFVESFVELFSNFNIKINWTTLNLVLPVGISFYTFQALSYSIDVYKKKLPACRDVIAFSAYISFFPQLVAGPIERATNLLPQFYKSRHFDYNQAILGARQILWGFFKKIVIADGAATIIDNIWCNIESYNSTTLIIGAILFAFQIYGDFSGYSDIAIGLARLFGFTLVKNFDLPYISRDVAEFWRRWHISLNKWFIDYIYIPLGGGSRKTLFVTIRNVFVIFLLSGLWHGANWTYIVWGLYHAILFIPLLLFRRNRNNIGVVAPNRLIPSLKDSLQILVTFLLVTIGWVIFRAESLQDGWLYLSRMADISQIGIPNLDGRLLMQLAEVSIAIFILIIVEWYYRAENIVLVNIPPITQWICWILIAVWSILFYSPNQTFIYFQF
ncbi:MAG: MBOAT family protein [Coprobacter sp.]|nr:MBOAT family protein [Coprobacter sp.]